MTLLDKTICKDYLNELPITELFETFGMFRKVLETIILRENGYYLFFQGFRLNLWLYKIQISWDACPMFGLVQLCLTALSGARCTCQRGE